MVRRARTEERIFERTATIKGVGPPVRYNEQLVQEAQLHCLLHGSTRTVQQCFGCDRFAGFVPEPGRRSVRVLCRRPRLARGSGQIALPPRCASCGSQGIVGPHPRMPSVPVCLDCLEQEATPIDYVELGCGD